MDGGFGLPLAWAAKKVYDLLRDRTDRYTPSVRKLLEKIGNKKIKEIRICREPINSVITKVLNVISLGNWNKNTKALGYDNVFHLFMKIELDDNNHYLIEKNETIKIAPFNKHVTESVVVPIYQPNITLMDMLEATKRFMGERNYFVYSPSKYNCQNYLSSFLTANGLNTPKLEEFVLQSAAKIIQGLPWIKCFPFFIR